MADAPRQLPLDLAHAPGMGRDDFIVSASNAQAMALIDSWPDWPSPVVVLAGPTGSGKTHLAAIWRYEHKAHSVDPSSVTKGDLERAATRPVLVDAVTEASLDEPGLFHLINTVREHGRTALFTARRFPAAWGVALPDLESRLKAATVTEIGEPDDFLLAAAITKLFADRQLAVEPHVVHYIASRIERSLATAISVVDHVDRLAMEEKARITRQLAARVIGAHDAGQGELGI
jgi:chromosomal replication initiation ATPase DnaA